MRNFSIYSVTNFIDGNFTHYALIEFPTTYKTDGEECLENEVYLYFHNLYDDSFLVCNFDGPNAVMNEWNNAEDKRTPILYDIPRKFRDKRDEVAVSIKLIVPILTEKEASEKANNAAYERTIYINKKGTLKMIGFGSTLTPVDSEGKEITPTIIERVDWALE